MKTLLITLSFLFTIHAMAQGAPRKMEFWDGSFAYNKLNVSEHPFQGNIIKIRLSGSQLGLTQQLEGTQDFWGPDDGMEISLRKKECAIDFIKKSLSCSADKVSVRNLTWHVNPRISKVFKGIIHELKIDADKTGVSVKFRVESDEFFTPHSENIAVGFGVLSL